MKSSRQQKILEIIAAEPIETQEELAARLEAEGFQVTQATVSRDIRDLKLSKVSMGDDKSRSRYVSMMQHNESRSDEKLLRVMREGFVSMDQAENLIVVKTVAGMAMAVAAAIDAMKMDQIVGCIAGDDTIFCAVRTVAVTPDVMNQIRQLLSTKS